jgi:integrase/recombinase XerD
MASVIETWLETFIEYKNDKKNLSAGTKQSYRSDLRDFFAYLERQGVREARELRPPHLSGYMSLLRLESRSAATISRRLVSLKAFCRYLTIARALDQDPSLQFDSPRLEKRVPRTLSVGEVDKLLETIDLGSATGLRDRAMLELLYATGLRVSELVSLDGDSVRADLGFLSCLGPGGRERMVPLGSLAAAWLERYHAEGRPELVKQDKPSDALLLNPRGQRITRQGFWKNLKKRAAHAGIEGEITPHTLRRSFARHLVDNGADVRAVQEMLGTSAASISQWVPSAVKIRVKDEYDRAHPRARAHAGGSDERKREENEI